MVIDLQEILKPSPLEKEYIELYGEEFVKDLKDSYYWMRRDMKKQPPSEKVVAHRRSRHHNIGEWSRIFYVDFQNQDMYSVCIDDWGETTIYNCGHSPCLRSETDHNVRYLLSGMFFYNKDKTRKWLNELLGPGEKCWFEKV